MTTSKYVLILLTLITISCTIFAILNLVQQFTTPITLNLPLQRPLDIIFGIIVGYGITQLKRLKFNFNVTSK